MNVIPSISVIIPVYNAENYLEQCLNSVINQTMQDLEIICVDDGSTDNSSQILKRYAEKDDRITILTQNNLYAGVARNNGLSVAKGEYVHFLDADDWLEQNAYKQWYEIAKDRDADVCVCFHKCIDNETGKVTERATILEKQYISESNFYENPSCFIKKCSDVPWNKIYRRKFLQEHDIHFDDLKCENEKAFYYKVMLNADRIVVIQDYWLHHRINNPLSLTGIYTRSKHYDCQLRAFDEISELISNCEDSIKIMFFDKRMNDLLYFYRKTIGTEMGYNIHEQLVDYLQKIDFSLLGIDIFKYGWYREYHNLTEGSKQFNEHDENNPCSYTPKIIISLTSFPARIQTIHYTIKTLFSQTKKADHVFLWLAKTQFPNLYDDLPQNLLSLCEKGLEIKWCDDDIMSHKKYYYTMQMFPEDIVITVDDDIYYESNMVQSLYNSYLRYPNAVSALRTHLITFENEGTEIALYKKWNKKFSDLINIPSMRLCATGCCGILYPPHCMHPELFNLDMIKKTCIKADDLWLKIMQIMNNTPTVLVKPNKKNLNFVENTQDNSLWHENVKQNGNDNQLNLIMFFYNNFYGNTDTLIKRMYIDPTALMYEAFFKKTGEEIKKINFKLAKMDKKNRNPFSRFSRCCKYHGFKYTIKRAFKKVFRLIK